MKALTTTVALLALSGGFAQAADFGTSSPAAASGETDPLAPPWGGISVTQNEDPETIIPGLSVHCGYTAPYPTVHTDNSYIRRFHLLEHDIDGLFRVNSVDFAIELAGSFGGSGAPLTQPVDVNLYEIADDASLLLANLAVLGATTIQIPNDGTADVQLFRAPMHGERINPYVHHLVVELFTPEGSDLDRNYLYIGANNLGEIRPSYLVAAACGVFEPASFEDLGFNIHIIMVVNGELVGAGTPARTTTWGAVKALYQ